jgi:hypothetical protein
MSNRKRVHAAANSAPELDVLSPPPSIAQMSLFGVQMMHANLTAARAFFDAWRSMVRAQQDTLLDAFDTQIHEAVPADESADAPAVAAANSQTYVAPHDAQGLNRHGALDAFA